MFAAATAVTAIKRVLTGQLRRDVDTITAPFSMVADPSGGSRADLRRAVVARQVLETELDPEYVQFLLTDIDGGRQGLTFTSISTMAARAVLSGSWDELEEVAYRIDTRHWLVRELAAA